MGKVNFVLEAQEASAVQAFLRVVDAQRKTEEGFKRVVKAGDDLFETGFRKAEGYAKWLVGGAGILAAFKAINAEIQKTIELQGRAASRQVDVAGAEQEVIRQLSGLGDATVKRVLGEGGRIAADTGVSRASIQRAIATALSATGQDIDASLSGVRQIARSMPDSPDAIAEMVGSLFDLRQLTGTTDAAVNQGYLQQVGALSRITNPRLQATNMPRGLIGMKAFGATRDEAAAFYAALTNASADVTGAQSATGATRFANQLETFMGAGGAGQTMGQRINMLLANPQLAQQFFAGSDFDAQVKGPIKEFLLTPGSQMRQMYQQGLGAIPDNAGLANIAEQSIRQRGLSAFEATAAGQRAFKSTEESLLLQNLSGGRGAVTREGLKMVLDAAGAGALEGKLKGMLFEGQSGFGGPEALGAAQSILRSEQRSRLNPMGYAGSSLGPGAVQAVPREATALERAQADAIGNLISAIEVLKTAIEANTEATDTNSKPKVRPSTSGQ